MSSLVEGNGKRHDPSAHENTSIAEDKYPQQSEQSVPEKAPASDQARSHRPFDEEPRPRSLDPQSLRDPPSAPRALGRLAFVVSLIIAASVGAAIALFAPGKLPSELNKMLGFSADNTTIASKPAGDTKITREQPGLATAQPAIASTEPSGEDLASIASARGATESASTTRGVTDNEIRLGISAPFTGSAKELGNQMKVGIETAFNLINDSGGIHGRQLRLVAADDGYEPTRTGETMKELYDNRELPVLVLDFFELRNVATNYALKRRADFLD
jgi:hypothetical protein